MLPEEFWESERKINGAIHLVLEEVKKSQKELDLADTVRYGISYCEGYCREHTDFYRTAFMDGAKTLAEWLVKNSGV